MPADVVELVAKAWPPALTVPEEADGSLPLHLAAQMQSGPRGAAVVKVLVTAEPRTLTTCHLGLTPLELAMQTYQYEKDISVVQALVEATMTSGESNGAPLLSILTPTPNLPTPLVQSLIQAQPQPLLTADGDGNLPMHIIATQFWGCAACLALGPGLPSSPGGQEPLRGAAAAPGCSARRAAQKRPGGENPYRGLPGGPHSE